MQNINESKPRESRLRSVLKGISWRIIATLATGIIAWRITGEVLYALKIGGIEIFVKFALYYFHERAWQTVPRGTIRRIVNKEHKK